MPCNSTRGPFVRFSLFYLIFFGKDAALIRPNCCARLGSAPSQGTFGAFGSFRPAISLAIWFRESRCQKFSTPRLPPAAADVQNRTEANATKS